MSKSTITALCFSFYSPFFLAKEKTTDWDGGGVKEGQGRHCIQAKKNGINGEKITPMGIKPKKPSEIWPEAEIKLILIIQIENKWDQTACPRNTYICGNTPLGWIHGTAPRVLRSHSYLAEKKGANTSPLPFFPLSLAPSLPRPPCPNHALWTTMNHRNHGDSNEVMNTTKGRNAVLAE